MQSTKSSFDEMIKSQKEMNQIKITINQSTAISIKSLEVQLGQLSKQMAVQTEMQSIKSLEMQLDQLSKQMVVQTGIRWS